MLRRRSGSSSSSSLPQDDRSPTQSSVTPTRFAFERHPLWSEAKAEEQWEGISEWEAGVSLAKAIMGAGSFALPWAFSKMGYLAGPMVLVVFLGLSVHSIGLLVDCARWLRKRSNSNIQSCAVLVSYVDVARATFGYTGAALAYAASIASSIGVCGSYLVFVAVNLSALLGMGKESTSIGETETAHERRLFLVLVWLVALPIAVLLSSVRDPKRFAEVSMWGDLSVVVGMVAVVVYGVHVAFAESNTKNTSSFADCVAIGSLKDVALALGSIGYLFLVHFLVLPIELSMVDIANAAGRDGNGSNNGGSNSSDIEAECDDHVQPNLTQNRFQNVVIRTFLVCGGIGGAFGIIGYFLFGTNTQQIILLNVEGSIGMAVVQSLLCIDLLLTYPVVMRPSIKILEDHWKQFLLEKKRKVQEQSLSEDDGMQMVALVSSANVTSKQFLSSRGKSLSLPSNDSNYMIPLTGNNHQQEGEQNAVVLNSWNHITVCLSLGVVAAGAGSFVPAFGLLSGLVGGVSQTFLAFVLPPLMWAKQQQLRNGGSESSAWACFGILPWKEKALVLCGLGLIGWTLQSTWAGLGSGEL